GGFFAFSAYALHPIVGFFATWSYFIAKLSSATLVIHVFATTMQKLFPVLSCINLLAFDIIILTVLLSLNMFNIQTGSKIQSWLMIVKLFPIVFVILSGLFLFQSAYVVPAAEYIWSGVPSTIPLVLHAMLGFEAACAIGRNMHNPDFNGPRAVFFSYLI